MPYVVRRKSDNQYRSFGRLDWTLHLEDARTFRRESDAWLAVRGHYGCRKEEIEILQFEIRLTPQPQARIRPAWPDYFMGLAFLASQRSHDSQTQHGCVIADSDTHRILGVGYNGFPRNIEDDDLPTTRPEKYPWMIHSEVNAVSNCTVKPQDAVAYVTGEPCNNCLMHLWQNGVAAVVYANRHGSFLLDEKTRAIREKFLELSGMELMELDPDLSWLRNLEALL